MKTFLTIFALLFIFSFIIGKSVSMETRYYITQNADSALAEIVYSDTTDRLEYQQNGQIKYVQEMPAFPASVAMFGFQ